MLVDYAISWARSNTSLEWIDLHVLLANKTAIHLYQRAGFVRIGEMADMFKLDGFFLTDITMTKRLYRPPTE